MEGLPPHDHDAESVVIGAMMLDPEALAVILDMLEPADFYREKNSWAFEIIQTLTEKGVMVNQITVASELAHKGKLNEMGGTEFLSCCINDVPTTVGIASVARIVKQNADARRLIQAGGQIAGLGYEAGDITAALAESERLISEVQGTRRETGIQSLRQLAERYFDTEESIDQDTGELIQCGIPTGFIDLDKILGGMQQQDLILLAARTSMGKTSLAINIAKNAAEAGYIGLIFSLEQSDMQIFQRILSDESNVDAQRIRLKRLDDMERVKVLEGLAKVADLPLYIDGTSEHHVHMMVATAKRLQSTVGLDFIVVDYLGLVRPRKETGNEGTDVSGISRGLKAMARAVNVPVLALAQMNRSIEGRADKTPMLSDLRSSGSLEQDSDVVIFIHRDDYYFTEEQWRKHNPTQVYPLGIADIIVAKHRNGPLGRCPMLFVGATMRFKTLVTNYT